MSYYHINVLVKEGKIKKIKKSVYENLEFNGEENDFYTVDAYISRGVVCLMSAAVYHGLTTYRPFVIEVAVERSYKVNYFLDYPTIEIFYFSDFRHKFGVLKINEEDGSYKIYDVEKTVCDIIFYRNKVGIEDMKEIITNYLKRKDRDLNKLVKYAKKLKVYNVLKTYMEVLV